MDSFRLPPRRHRSFHMSGSIVLNSKTQNIPFRPIYDNRYISNDSCNLTFDNYSDIFLIEQGYWVKTVSMEMSDTNYQPSAYPIIIERMYLCSGNHAILITTKHLIPGIDCSFQWRCSFNSINYLRGIRTQPAVYDFNYLLMRYYGEENPNALLYGDEMFFTTHPPYGVLHNDFKQMIYNIESTVKQLEAIDQTGSPRSQLQLSHLAESIYSENSFTHHDEKSFVHSHESTWYVNELTFQATPPLIDQSLLPMVTLSDQYTVMVNPLETSGILQEALRIPATDYVVRATIPAYTVASPETVEFQILTIVDRYLPILGRRDNYFPSLIKAIYDWHAVVEKKYSLDYDLTIVVEKTFSEEMAITFYRNDQVTFQIYLDIVVLTLTFPHFGRSCDCNGYDDSSLRDVDSWDQS